uniref:Uncharacterized protein n=1 Tax=Anguilla anguilla TaxID=7936 RepID=A0A0E9UHZ3_ANGAN
MSNIIERNPKLLITIH